MSVTVEKQLTREQLEKVRGKLAAKGVALSGDVGTFEGDTPMGRIAGTFAYAEGRLAVNVTKHRWGAGRFIEGGIKSGIEEAIL